MLKTILTFFLFFLGLALSAEESLYSDNKLHEEFKKYISFSETEQNFIGYLRIGNERAIDQSTYIYIRFALEDFIAKGVRCVVLDLNTPGGEVLAALNIVDLLHKLDRQYQIPVIAFINDWAVSAGAMLAYGCRFIGTQPNALMGAAEPVIMKGEGQMETASEKVNSALRAEFANLASLYGRNPLIAEAMVDKDKILVLRENKVIQLQDPGEFISMSPNPDKMISAKGKLLTLNAKELMEYGVADFEVPFSSLPLITTEELEKGAWPADKMLVFAEPYLAQIPNATMIDYQDWRVGLFSFLMHPAVASLLFMGLIVGLYIELSTPGFGIPGCIALGCLALILLSTFASFTVNWIEVIILAIGVTLLAVELFVLPGFGLIGVIGILLTVIGLFALMLPGIERLNFFEIGTFNLVGINVLQRLAWLFAALLLAVLVIFLLGRFFSQKSFYVSRLVLKGEQEKGAGYVAGIPHEMMPKEGQRGETVTPLRPAGKAQFNENLFDVQSLGGFIAAQVAVEVVCIEGSKLIVKPLKTKE